MLTWYFSESDGRVTCPEQSVQLTPKAAAVLACLMRHSGSVVTIETFLNEVWPGIQVTADLVREYVSDLRAALHDDARNPQYIETVLGKGFRLIGGVEPATTDDPSDAQAALGVVRPTVAVLKPMVAGEDSLKHFGEGITSDIINQLARFHEVGVVARHSSFTADQVTDLRAFARDVQAEYILESSIAAFGPSVRARFQLVDADTSRNLWAKRFDVDASDVHAASDRITNAVVLALTGWHGELHRAQFKMVKRKREAELNAFEHFVLGCDLEMRFDADGLGRTLYHMEQAVTLDPSFARAWLLFALQLQWAFDVMPGRDRTYLERSAKAFETAFTLAPADPVTLALVSLKVAREESLSAALSMLERAEASMDGDVDAQVCVATSKAVLSDDIAGARRIFDAALRENQTPPSWYHFVEARIAFLAGEYERCVACSRSGPQQISAMVFRCLSLAMLGRPEDALIAHDDLISAYPDTDFVQFADFFPIANPARRRDYDAAVDRLRAIIAETETRWPSFAQVP